MNSDPSIAELFELLERSYTAADPRELLRDIESRLELLITRHNVETSPPQTRAAAVRSAAGGS